MKPRNFGVGAGVYAWLSSLCRGAVLLRLRIAPRAEGRSKTAPLQKQRTREGRQGSVSRSYERERVDGARPRGVPPLAHARSYADARSDRAALPLLALIAIALGGMAH